MQHTHTEAKKQNRKNRVRTLSLYLFAVSTQKYGTKKYTLYIIIPICGVCNSNAAVKFTKIHSFGWSFVHILNSKLQYQMFRSLFIGSFSMQLNFNLPIPNYKSFKTDCFCVDCLWAVHCWTRPQTPKESSFSTVNAHFCQTKFLCVVQIIASTTELESILTAVSVTVRHNNFIDH